MILSVPKDKLMLLVLILISVCFLFYCAYRDLKHRWFYRRSILIMYPLFFYVNYKINENIILTTLAFLFLFLVFYITEVINSKEGLGTIDILAAPLFSVWFNAYSFYFTLLFFLMYLLCWIPYINKNLLNRGKDTNNTPILTVLFATFILALIVFPNNIGIFFSTFLS